MAKAQYHKNQRVYVLPVGTYAQIERVVPHWVKDVNEPLKITYDVGLGRDFGAEEIRLEEITGTDAAGNEENWRLVRGANKWKSAEECAHHPHPGTYPVIITHDKDWGGWRVPGAEYDQNPHRIEAQSRMIAYAPTCAAMLRKIIEYADEQPENMSNQLMDLVQQSRKLIEAFQN